MNKTWRTILAVGSTLLLLISFILIFIFAWGDGVKSTYACVLVLYFGYVFAPIVHEFGHVVFAKKADMDIIYFKAF